MKDSYSVVAVSKHICSNILEPYHYLSNISKGFKSGFNVGLYHLPTNSYAGVCIFTGFPVPELSVGMFGLDRNDQNGLFELSRLCLVPQYQQQEHNLASWFIAKAIKMLRQSNQVRCILSYADNDYHSGTVYAASNFDYYGLTAPKKDFWINTPEGLVKHSRGATKHLDGEWKPRTQKHRFIKLFDKSLKIKWQHQKWNPNAKTL